MKKKIKILITFILVISFLIAFNNKVNAAMEIKDGATGYKVSNPPNNAFSMCYDLRNPTSTLAKNTLDPHLTLSADWASMLYLGLSGYGDVTSTNDKQTTTNKSGVKHKNVTSQCYPLMSSVVEDNVGSSTGKIIDKMNTKYVDKLKSSGPNKGLGYEELKFFNNFGPSFNNVYYYRYGYISQGLSSGNNTWGWMNARPVIWN